MMHKKMAARSAIKALKASKSFMLGFSNFLIIAANKHSGKGNDFFSRCFKNFIYLERSINFDLFSLHVSLLLA